MTALNIHEKDTTRAYRIIESRLRDLENLVAEYETRIAALEATVADHETRITALEP